MQDTHTYTQYTQCTIKTYLVIKTHYTPYVHIYIMYTSIHSNNVKVQQIINLQQVGCAKVQQIMHMQCRGYDSDSRCFSAVCACSPVELC